MILKRLLLNPTPDVGGGSVIPAKVELKEPPTEVLAQTFNSDDLDLDTGENIAVEEKPPVTAKPTAETPVVEQPPVVEQKPVVAKPTTQQPTVAVKPPLGEVVKPTTRDYTGFSDDEVKALKQMSNEAFTFASNVLKQNKTLAKTSGEVYYQHPNAFVLDPEYQKLQEDSWYADQEARIWQEQLMNIKAARPWKPLTGWTKDGKPVYGAEQQPTDLAEEEVRQNMQMVSQVSNNAKMQAQQFQQSYNNRVQSDVTAIDQIQSQKFSWVADPKLADTVINVPNVGDRSLKQIKADFTSLLPAYMRNHKLADVCGNMFVALQIYANEIRNASKQVEQTQQQKQEILRAEPTSTARGQATPQSKGRGGWAGQFDDLPPM